MILRLSILLAYLSIWMQPVFGATYSADETQVVAAVKHYFTADYPKEEEELNKLGRKQKDRAKFAILLIKNRNNRGKALPNDNAYFQNIFAYIQKIESGIDVRKSQDGSLKTPADLTDEDISILELLSEKASIKKGLEISPGFRKVEREAEIQAIDAALVGKAVPQERLDTLQNLLKLNISNNGICWRSPPTFSKDIYYSEFEMLRFDYRNLSDLIPDPLDSSLNLNIFQLYTDYKEAEILDYYSTDTQKKATAYYQAFEKYTPEAQQMIQSATAGFKDLAGSATEKAAACEAKIKGIREVKELFAEDAPKDLQDADLELWKVWKYAQILKKGDELVGYKAYQEAQDKYANDVLTHLQITPKLNPFTGAPYSLTVGSMVERVGNEVSVNPQLGGKALDSFEAFKKLAQVTQGLKPALKISENHSKKKTEKQMRFAYAFKHDQAQAQPKTQPKAPEVEQTAGQGKSPDPIQPVADTNPGKNPNSKPSPQSPSSTISSATSSINPRLSPDLSSRSPTLLKHVAKQPEESGSMIRSAWFWGFVSVAVATAVFVAVKFNRKSVERSVDMEPQAVL